jgi:hypothetical protein
MSNLIKGGTIKMTEDEAFGDGRLINMRACCAPIYTNRSDESAIIIHHCLHKHEGKNVCCNCGFII